MRPGVHVRWAAALALFATTGCQLIAGIEDLRDSPDGGGVADGGSAMDSGGAPTDDAACPGNAGPEPVRVGEFCVDSTEVTNAQYGLFVGQTGGDAGGQISVCTWNTSYTPPDAGGWNYPSGEDKRPAANVDWCDAYAYCRWAGKRLCGAIGGGPAPYEMANQSSEQWVIACQRGPMMLMYPYGNTYEPRTCNGADLAVGRTVDVGSLKCEGGYQKIFDMSGNVFEWEDACSDTKGATDECMARGGAFGTALSDMLLGCTQPDSVVRSDAYDDLGFRCCSNP